MEEEIRLKKSGSLWSRRWKGRTYISGTRLWEVRQTSELDRMVSICRKKALNSGESAINFSSSLFSFEVVGLPSRSRGVRLMARILKKKKENANVC